MILNELATKYLLEYYKKNPNAVKKLTGDMKGFVINDYNSLIKKNDNYYGQMTKLLTQYEKSKTSTKKLSIIKKILEIDPTDVDALTRLCTLDKTLDNETQLNKLLALEIKTKEDIIKQGLCKFDAKEEKEETDYFMVLYCRPYLRLLSTIANCYMRLDNDSKAVEYLEKVNNYCKKDQLQTSSGLACLYFKIRDYNKGILFCKKHESTCLTCYLVKHLFLITNNTETYKEAFTEIADENWILGAVLARKISMTDQELDEILTGTTFFVKGSLKESALAVEMMINEALKDNKERVEYSTGFGKAGKNFELMDYLYVEDVNILGAMYFSYNNEEQSSLEIKNTALFNLLVGKGAKSKLPRLDVFYGAIPDMTKKEFKDNLDILYELNFINISSDDYCSLTIEGQIILESVLNESAKKEKSKGVDR